MCVQVKDGTLSLCQLQLTRLPAWVEEKRCAKALRKLELRRNRLTAVPDVSFLSKLTSLSVNSNAVSGALGPAGLPPSIEHLNVAGNTLTSVDAALLEAGNHCGATYEEVRAFASAALAQQPPTVSLSDGSKAVLMGLAAHRSIDSGQPVLWSDMLAEYSSALDGARERLRVELERLRRRREEATRARGVSGGDASGIGVDARAEVPAHLYRAIKVVWRRASDADEDAYTAKELRETFEKIGRVEDVVIREGKKKKGSALVVFGDEETCVQASRVTCGRPDNALIISRAAVPPEGRASANVATDARPSVASDEGRRCC